MQIIRSRRRAARWRRVAMIAMVIVALAELGSRCSAGLMILPTFDSTITSDANAAAIEGVINSAIGIYETRFSDPITVTINFKEMTSGLGASNWWFYNIPYQTYRNDLSADSSTGTDTTGLAFLPTGTTNPVNSTGLVSVKTANLRAIGITGDNSGLAGGVDGIVSLNTHITNVGSPGTSGLYSLMSTTEHEIDEVLGLGSALPSTGNNPYPEDLFRYTPGPGGARSFTTSGDNAYFSLDGGTTDLARFNQDAAGDYGDWWSNNGGGNPGPSPPTEVQDAFLFGNRTPTLGVELTALDVIGYNLVPEPSNLSLLATCVALLGWRAHQRRKKFARGSNRARWLRQT